MSDQPAAAAQASAADPAQTHVAADWSHTSPQLACRFDPSGEFVFASAMDFSIRRFRVSDGQQVALTGHGSWVRALATAVHPSLGPVLVSGGYEGRLIFWPVVGDAPMALRTIEAHQGWIRAVAISPDGLTVASGGNDNRVRIWSLADGTMVRELPPHPTQVHSLAFAPTGTDLFAGDLKGTVHQWRIAAGDPADGTTVRQFNATALYKYEPGQGVDFGGVRSLALSADGKYLAAGGTTDASNPLGAIHKPLVLYFDVATGEQRQAHRAKENFDGVVWSLRFHPSGYLIGCTGGGGGGNLLFWKPEEASEVVKIALPNLARDMDMAADALRLVTTHADGHTRLLSMTPKPAA